MQIHNNSLVFLSIPRITSYMIMCHGLAAQSAVYSSTDLRLPDSKLNLKLNFENQSFQPKNKKVIKTV